MIAYIVLPIQIESKGDDSDETRKHVEAFLDSSENDIKAMFVDVQTLKDANYHQAEDMYKT